MLSLKGREQKQNSQGPFQGLIRAFDAKCRRHEASELCLFVSDLRGSGESRSENCKAEDEDESRSFFFPCTIEGEEEGVFFTCSCFSGCSIRGRCGLRLGRRRMRKPGGSRLPVGHSRRNHSWGKSARRTEEWRS